MRAWLVKWSVHLRVYPCGRMCVASVCVRNSFAKSSSTFLKEKSGLLNACTFALEFQSWGEHTYSGLPFLSLWYQVRINKILYVWLNLVCQETERKNIYKVLCVMMINWPTFVIIFCRCENTNQFLVIYYGPYRYMLNLPQSKSYSVNTRCPTKF